MEENHPLMVPGSAFVYFSENCFLYTFMAFVLYTDFADDENTSIYTMSASVQLHR